MIRTVSGTPYSPSAPVEIRVTTTTVGASLRPDSASRTPVRRLGSGTIRSTENTAAESVGEQTAPSRTASCHGSPRTKWPKTAIARTETPTPTVASANPSRMDGRTSPQSVVRPPSARITTSAPKPSAWASW